MFKKLQLTKAELVAVLMTALDQGETDLVNALEFCAITGIELRSLSAFTSKECRRFLHTGESDSPLIRRVLGNSADAQLCLSRYMRSNRRRRTYVFGHTMELLYKKDLICKELGIGCYQVAVTEPTMIWIERGLLHKLYQVYPTEYVPIAATAKKSSAEPLVLAFA